MQLKSVPRRKAVQLVKMQNTSIKADVINDFETTIFYVGNIRIKLKQNFTKLQLSCPNIKQQLTLLPNKSYFIWLESTY